MQKHELITMGTLRLNPTSFGMDVFLPDSGSTVTNMLKGEKEVVGLLLKLSMGRMTLEQRDWKKVRLDTQGRRLGVFVLRVGCTEIILTDEYGIHHARHDMGFYVRLQMDFSMVL